MDESHAPNDPRTALRLITAALDRLEQCVGELPRDEALQLLAAVDSMLDALVRELERARVAQSNVVTPSN